MPLADIPGYAEAFPLGDRRVVLARDFDILVFFNFDRCYDESREQFERNVDIVLKGKGGMLGLRLGNVECLEVRGFYQWPGFELDDIRNQGWGRKFFKVYCLESDAVLGLAESAQLYAPLQYH